MSKNTLEVLTLVASSFQHGESDVESLLSQKLHLLNQA